MITIIVPLTPPSVNIYVRHAKGRHFKAKNTLTFEGALAFACQGKHVAGTEFAVSIRAYFGPRERKDVDNLCKAVLDQLARSGVFVCAKRGTPKTDSAVKRLYVEKFTDDRTNPRTEITVEAI